MYSGSSFEPRMNCLCGCPVWVFAPSRMKIGVSSEPTVSEDCERRATAVVRSGRLSTKRMARVFYHDLGRIYACVLPRMIYVVGSVDDAHVGSLPC